MLRTAHHRPRRAELADLRDAGFTLIEITIAIILMGVVIVPLGVGIHVSFWAGINATTTINSSLSRQQLASTFADDVASTDATGDNSSSASGATCTSPLAAGGSLVVNLNSTAIDGTAAKTRRVSYWAIGSGANIGVVRSLCDDISVSTAGVGMLVADGLQAPGLTGGDIVKGGLSGVVCDEVQCEIEVLGLRPFTLSAQRRVYGAGVPLQRGSTFSSTSLLYPQYTITAASAGTEQAWPGFLSLAPGLDTTGSLAVQFRVLQGTSNMYYDPASTPDPFTAPSTSSDTAWFDATVDSTTTPSAPFWKLDLPMSSLTRGGEYRVWTRITRNGVPKVYGGSDVDGFPFWVDWNPSEVVLVSNATTGPWVGLDTNAGIDTADDGTAPEPVATILKGLQVAASTTSPRAQVLVVNNATAYGPTVVTGTGFTNRTITGGFDPVTLKRALPDTVAGTGLTSITGTSSGADANAITGLTVNADVNLRLRQLKVASGLPSNTAHRTAYGMRVLGSAEVIFERSTATALDGAGFTTAGAQGASRGDACHGPIGDVRNTARNEKPFIPTTTPSTYGLDPCPGATVTEDRVGGYGGAGGNSSGTWGAEGGRGGNSTAGPAGGGGGRGDGSFPCDPAEGGIGTSAVAPAVTPTAGAAGTAGRTWNGTPAEDWVPVDGGDGITGADGWGGGGAGGGGGNGCPAVSNNGARGSRGGVAGRGGEGGKGGKSGGSSFGIYVYGTGSKVTVAATARVVASAGGAGSDGGAGGIGGRGGNGGPAVIQTSTGESTQGAGGGGGGNGGGGGGGGAGGWSVAVMSFSSAGSDVQSGATLQSAAVAISGTGGATTTFKPAYMPASAANGNGGGGGLGGDGAAQYWWIIRTGESDPGNEGSRGRSGNVGPGGATPVACAKVNNPTAATVTCAS